MPDDITKGLQLTFINIFAAPLIQIEYLHSALSALFSHSELLTFKIQVQMKKHVLITVSVTVFFFSVLSSFAQGITVVSNTSAPDLFAWEGSGALSGYSGTPIELNGSLILEYNPSSDSRADFIIQQLAVYTPGSTTFTLIPNPDGGQGVYFNSVQLIFQNKLFFIYLNAAGKQQLASFDGTSITLYPNPDNGLGYIGSPRIYNNQLYGAYSNAAGVTQFGLFTGTGLSLIPNPTVSAKINTGFYFNYAVVYGGKLVARYINADSSRQLASFDGASWTLIPNPDNTAFGQRAIFPTLYHNVLYWIYRSATSQFQFMTYDSTGKTGLVANPENLNGTLDGISGFPIVANDTLFFQYFGFANTLQVGKFGGTSISLVPNPDNSQYGFYNTPIVYNNNLYIFYVTSDGRHHLTQYVPASNSLKVYPNPDGGYGYWDQPIVYDNRLFFMYYNASNIFQLGYFDGGSSLSLITNPGGIYNGSGGNNGYTGYPYIYNNLLYMQFGSIPYGNAGNLAYFDASVLPVTFFGFSVKENNNTSLLQWKTANEINNAYFTVERSTDGVSFQPIGRVEGHGNNTGQQTYQFSDNAPSTGTNYYRLRQVDVNGSYHYSDIEKLTFAHLLTIFKVSPNPATDHVQVSFTAGSQPSVIQVYNAAGVKVAGQTVAAGQTTQSVSLLSLPAGTYRITLVQGTQHQTVQVLKR